ncbi:MAG: pantetheine-phosphate adenylyltransferase [Candidatus Cloacimonetes bacterium]|nr:pantetheine-phosphate adenylyltransferase [Candidatus Cloacimonadota bacterium]
MKRALYPGTFDPITNGHLDILKKAARIFDEVILAVASITGKDTTFTVEERLELCRQATQGMANIRILSFDGLVVDCARKTGALAMIRGLRAISDFEYELSLAMMNKKLYGDLDTIFLVPDNKYLYLSSTIIKQVVYLNGNIPDLIPQCVEQALKKKNLQHNNDLEKK